jgi:hypothetical protein
MMIIDPELEEEAKEAVDTVLMGWSNSLLCG